MRVVTHRLPYSAAGEVYTLYHLTDLHLGARAANEKLLERDIKRIAADPNARWIGGGDYTDAISRKGDKRANEAVLARWLYGIEDVVGAQADRTRELLGPIAPQCLGLVSGNHEEAVKAHTGTDIYWYIVRYLAEAAGRDPRELALGVQGFVRLLFTYEAAKSSGKTWTMDIMTHHGAGGGALPGGHALALGRLLGRYDADLVLVGHRHVYVAIDSTHVAVTPRGRLAARERLAMFVPSYLNTYVIPSKSDRLTDTYPEQKMLPPSGLGTVPVRIIPEEQSFESIKRTKAGYVELAVG